MAWLARKQCACERSNVVYLQVVAKVHKTHSKSQSRIHGSASSNESIIFTFRDLFLFDSVATPSAPYLQRAEHQASKKSHDMPHHESNTSSPKKAKRLSPLGDQPPHLMGIGPILRSSLQDATQRPTQRMHGCSQRKAKRISPPGYQPPRLMGIGPILRS